MSTTQQPDRILRLPRAEIVDDALVFEADIDAHRACEVGAFLVSVPQGLDLRPGLEICRNFYKERDNPEDRYRGHRQETHPESKLGYEDRPDQVEQLQIEERHWEAYLPADFVALLRRMRQLTLASLYGVFDLAGVRPRDREPVTGGAAAGTGWCYTTVNHYRSDLDRDNGIVQHTDSGFITLIYTDQPGYEVLIDGQWRPVAYDPDTFVVNLGDGMDILTHFLPRPVAAVMHRVPRLSGERADRSSFTVYMGPRYDMSLFQYSADGELNVHQGFRDFSVAKAATLGYEFHSRV